MTPLLGFSGFSGSGKTTLLAALIALLHARGLCIGLVKHSHHAFDIDHPGKDTHTLRQAGASRVAIGSSKRWALMVERAVPHEASLGELVHQVDDPSLHLILVEGFRHETHPKIEVHRPSLGHPLLAVNDASVIAIATDDPGLDTCGRTRLPLDDVPRVEAFVLDYITAARGQRPAPVYGRSPA